MQVIMSRVRKLVRACISSLNRSQHKDCPLVLLNNVDDGNCVRLCLDSTGKLSLHDHEQKFEQFQLHRNQQLFFQIIKTEYCKIDNSVYVYFQASVIPSNYNIKTLSNLTCGNGKCCNQLFVSALYKDSIKFLFDKDKKKKLKFVAHKHGQYGNLYMYFDVVDFIAK